MSSNFIPEHFWLIESINNGKRNIIGIFDKEIQARDELDRIFKLKANDEPDGLEFCEEKATLTFRERRKTVTIRLAEY